MANSSNKTLTMPIYIGSWKKIFIWHHLRDIKKLNNEKYELVKSLMALSEPGDSGIRNLQLTFCPMASNNLFFFYHCLLTKDSANHFLVLIVYVNDLLISGLYEQDIIDIKTFLNRRFIIKDLVFVHYFRVQRLPDLMKEEFSINVSIHLTYSNIHTLQNLNQSLLLFQKDRDFLMKKGSY